MSAYFIILTRSVISVSFTFELEKEAKAESCKPFLFLHWCVWLKPHFHFIISQTLSESLSYSNNLLKNYTWRSGTMNTRNMLFISDILPSFREYNLAKIDEWRKTTVRNTFDILLYFYLFNIKYKRGCLLAFWQLKTLMCFKAINEMDKWE